MIKYFHIAPTLLGNQSVILPGNWGRLIRHPRRSHDASYHREIAMERVRGLRFAEKPSRLNCVFVLPNLTAVRAFRAIDTNFFNLVYEVEPVRPVGTVVHLGCWRLGLLDKSPIDESGNGLADVYWRGLRTDATHLIGVRVIPEDECAEVLVGDEVRVVRRLDESELV